MSRTTGPFPTGGSGSIPGSPGAGDLESESGIAPERPGSASGGRPSPGVGCGDGSGGSVVPTGEGNRRGVSGDWAFAPAIPTTSAQAERSRVARAILLACRERWRERFMESRVTTTATALPVAWRDPGGQARPAGRL